MHWSHIEHDLSIVHAGIKRARHFLEQQMQFAARGSEWEVELARRGLFKYLVPAPAHSTPVLTAVSR